MWQEGHDPTEWFSAELLEMIFNLLDVPDLLDCSLVNKKWQATAASVLLKYKKCIAYIDEPCCELLELNDTLKKSNLQRINGIHIRLGSHEGCCEDWKTPKLKKLFSAIINWPFWYIDVELDHYHSDDKITCNVVVRLAKEIFWTSRRTVRELSIGFDSHATDFFRHELARDGNGEDGSAKYKFNLFPELISIKFYGEYFPSDFYNFVNFSAPSLTEITGQDELLELGVVKSWNEPALRALKSVSITPKGSKHEEDEYVDFETLKKFASFETGLHFLRTKDRYGVAFPPSWLNPFAQIFRNSWGTLKRLHFCASEVVKIITELESPEAGTLMFPNVKRLDLSTPRGTSDAVDRSILRRIQIGTRFPHLEELIMNFGECRHELENEDEYEEDCEECPASDLSLDLETRFAWLHPETLGYFVDTFPLLTSLSVIIYRFFEDRDHAYSLSTLFSSFPHLKTLRLQLSFSVEHVTIPCFSLDAIFCGMTFEETQMIKLDYLRNGLDLKSLNIVAVRPGLTSAANLKWLQISMNSPRHPQTAWLSKISALRQRSILYGTMTSSKPALKCHSVLSCPWQLDEF